MKFKGVFPTVIAIAFGFLVLAGYIFPLFGQFYLFILNIAVILTGFAVLVGVSNLLIVHSGKIRHKQKGAIYSVILIISLLVTFLLGLVAHFSTSVSGLFNEAFLSIQLPIETSLMAVLVVTLTYASIRLLRQRRNLLSVIFLVTAFLIMVGTAPWPFLGDVPVLSALRVWIAQIPASAGARGILLGVGLGTLTTGLRILFGADRPYGGKHG
ncbi:MAG TPA: hypothetical protein VMT91_12435 [Anaerolineales bacterium]|nr:hypothetical protein [Anaerolineales bacterium]